MDNPPKTPKTPNDEFDEQTYAIIGAAIEVHRTLGCGYLERVYQWALGLEFLRRGIAFEAERPFDLRYKGNVLKDAYRADFLCFDRVIVETKALREMGSVELAQVINYLKAGELQTGLLLNFGQTTLEIRRVGFTPDLLRAPWIPVSALSASSVDGSPVVPHP